MFTPESRFSGSKFSVNRDQGIKAAILAVIIAHKSILGSDLNVTASFIAVNEDRANRAPRMDHESAIVSNRSSALAHPPAPAA